MNKERWLVRLRFVTSSPVQFNYFLIAMYCWIMKMHTVCTRIHLIIHQSFSFTLQEPNIIMKVTLTHLHNRPTIVIPPKVFTNIHRELPCIGQGGFAHVYKFTHTKMKYEVALKHIRLLNTKLTPEKMTEVLSEISLHSKLIHRNIVRFLGKHSSENALTIVLEFVDISLHGWLQGCFNEKTPMDAYTPVLSYPLIYRYTLDILRGLNHLHSKNIVHCDMKCMNILVTNGNVAKVADFGLSTTVGYLFQETF